MNTSFTLPAPDSSSSDKILMLQVHASKKKIVQNRPTQVCLCVVWEGLSTPPPSNLLKKSQGKKGRKNARMNRWNFSIIIYLVKKIFIPVFESCLQGMQKIKELLLQQSLLELSKKWESDIWASTCSVSFSSSQASVMKTLVSGYNEKTRILLQFLVKGCYSSYSARLKKTFIVPDPCCRNSIHWGNQGNYTPANPYSEGKICSPETARYWMHLPWLTQSGSSIVGYTRSYHLHLLFLLESKRVDLGEVGY